MVKLFAQNKKDVMEVVASGIIHHEKPIVVQKHISPTAEIIDRLQPIYNFKG